jgi:hypothetical protein
MRPTSARADLLRLINGFQASQAIHVAAKLKLADLLVAGLRSAEDLATATGAHPLSLYRLMRALAAIGVFHEDESGAFGLTEMGDFLRSGVAGSQAAMAQLIGQPSFWRAWGDLLFAVRSGDTAFDHVHGTAVWEYRRRDPEEGRVFDEAMASDTEASADAVMQVWDFGRYRRIVDVGGGDGTFLAKIMLAHPHVHGILFEQAQVLARAARTLESSRIAERCEIRSGDFFAGVPEAADAYLLKWILHDWDDLAAIQILRSCRRAMLPRSRLLVVEHVVGAPNAAPEGKMMDLTMMVMCGGRERTQREFDAVFAAAGLQPTSVTPTGTPLSLIECSVRVHDEADRARSQGHMKVCR